MLLTLSDCVVEIVLFPEQAGELKKDINDLFVGRLDYMSPWRRLPVILIEHRRCTRAKADAELAVYKLFDFSHQEGGLTALYLASVNIRCAASVVNASGPCVKIKASSPCTCAIQFCA